jgi:hypothetical protein
MSVRMLVGILVFTTLISLACGQEFSSVAPESNTKVRIHRLTIEADSLPDRDRERVSRVFDGCTCLQGELQARIYIAFQNLGYFKAHVNVPTVSYLGQTQGATYVDVSAKVDEGNQYYLGQIRFEKAARFQADQMRDLFRLRTGDLFTNEAIGEGLEQLRKLYATEGYIDFVAAPVLQIDETSRTIDLIIELSEGQPYDFGRLYLNGIKPHAGAATELLKSWGTLQGERYNPIALDHWLAANSSNLPSAIDWNRMADLMRDPKSHVVNIKLMLP